MTLRSQPNEQLRIDTTTKLTLCAWNRHACWGSARVVKAIITPIAVAWATKHSANYLTGNLALTHSAISLYSVNVSKLRGPSSKARVCESLCSVGIIAAHQDSQLPCPIKMMVATLSPSLEQFPGKRSEHFILPECTSGDVTTHQVLVWIEN